MSLIDVVHQHLLAARLVGPLAARQVDLLANALVKALVKAPAKAWRRGAVPLAKP